MYEPEERRIHDALEQWWIKIDDYETAWTGKTIALTRGVAKTISGWLGELFGRRALSIRTFVACICFSLASMLLLSFVFGIYTWINPITHPISPTRMGGFFCGFSFLFFMATRKRSNKFYEIKLGIAVAAVLGGTAVFFAATSGHTTGFYAGLLAGVACNFAVLLVTRRLAAWGGGTNHWAMFVILATLDAALGLGLFIAPMLLMNTGRMSGIAADVLGFGAISNVFGGTIAASFMILALALCLQKASWPFLSRPVYALWRFRVFQNRKLLFLAGSSLVALGVPSLSKVRESILSLFAH